MGIFITITRIKAWLDLHSGNVRSENLLVPPKHDFTTATPTVPTFNSNMHSEIVPGLLHP